MNVIGSALGGIGRKAFEFLTHIVRMGRLVVQALYWVFVGSLKGRGIRWGSTFEQMVLLSILQILEASQRSRRFIGASKPLCPEIYALVRDMPTCDPLIRGLKGAISSNGTIKDSASSALKRIRDKKVD